MPMHVVICGGGVIGACTAYFLARRGIDVTVVERAEVASSASGKAGGFLARRLVCGQSARCARAAKLCASRELARGDAAAGAISACPRTAASSFPSGDKRRHVAAGLDWLSGGVIIGAQLSTTETTAMVNPRSFTLGMMRAAEQHGARLRHGEVTGVVRRGETVAGVMLDGETIAADAIVIAMGPWSLRAATWLTLPLVFGLQSPSLVYDTGKDVPAEALFLDYQRGERRRRRRSKSFRAPTAARTSARFSGQAPLPMDPADVKPDPSDIARLQAICERLSPAFRPERIIARQACFRPVTQDGLPLIGKVPGSEGAYIATGHSVWGILNAPATGEAMAELIAEGGAKTTDLTPFDPARLRPLDPASIRIA